MTDKLLGNLKINGLELYLNLGWREKEQLEPQAILLDIDIYFREPPKAIETDHLKDTVCYADLIEKIRESTSQKTYRLIEKVSKDIYDLVVNALPPSALAYVSIAKKPKIKGLTGGVSYATFSPVPPKWDEIA